MRSASGMAAVEEQTHSAAAPDVKDPDGALVARIGAGDRAAAAELVNKHAPRMIRLAYRMLNDSHAAEDVAQEVFLRVWKAAPDWVPGEAKFQTWMHRVAINLCYDRLRKKRETLTETLPERPDEADGPADALQKSQTGAIVQEAVAKLPERQRVAITLCHYQELSNIEAAEIMGVSVEALESLLARGRRGLRAALEGLKPDLLGDGHG
ncbi:MAG: RNA polymerase sigma factor [Pseudomonadota bacterium]